MAENQLLGLRVQHLDQKLAFLLSQQAFHFRYQFGLFLSKQFSLLRLLKRWEVLLARDKI